MPSQNYPLTPEQQAKSFERKRKRDEARLKASMTPVPSGSTSPQPEIESSVLRRSWLVKNDSLNTASNVGNQYHMTIMSWNLLAQCLVRRELFPHSNCLKAQQREGMLHEEITQSNADAICLQEVDRLERLLPVLKRSGYDHVFACGPRKLHGCLIAFKETKFRRVTDQVVYYDDAYVRDEGDDNYCKGLSFRTKNVALIVALESLDSPGQYFVIATTHLFWHPRYTYERTRQAYILVRTVHEFRDANGFQESQLLIAGDFNFPPSDATYSLLIGDGLTADQESTMLKSYVVHVSVDPTIPTENDRSENGAEETDGNKESIDPDREIVNARMARPDDGLLLPEEFTKLFRGLLGANLKSAYDSWSIFGADRVFGSHGILPTNRHGRNEPIYTSYTYYWKTTLDYIFFMEQKETTAEVVGILQPPTQSELEPGIPRRGVSGSDHIPLRAKLLFMKNDSY